MNQFRIAADSSCNLLTLNGADFVSVPLTIRTETEEFRDDASLDVDAMVSTLRSTRGRSYSACPNVADWESAFGESGDMIAFTITSSLSGSYNAACVGREMGLERSPEKKIHIFDSESASAGETLIALMLRDRIDGGHSFEDIVAEMTAFIARMKTRFVLEDLSNLVKNGRISKVAGLLGGMLSLRPIMGDDGHGSIAAIEKVRGTQNPKKQE